MMATTTCLNGCHKSFTTSLYLFCDTLINNWSQTSDNISDVCGMKGRNGRQKNLNKSG